MADIVSLQVEKAYSIDRDEDTTQGVTISLQLGPLVLEWWATMRRPQERLSTLSPPRDPVK